MTELLDLSMPEFDAVDKAFADRWGQAEELAAINVELAHEQVRILLAVHAKSGHAPPPFRYPRPTDKEPADLADARDTWGSTPDAIAGQRAMMRLAGAPAPLREEG